MIRWNNKRDYPYRENIDREFYSWANQTWQKGIEFENHITRNRRHIRLFLNVWFCHIFHLWLSILLHWYDSSKVTYEHVFPLEGNVINTRLKENLRTERVEVHAKRTRSRRFRSPLSITKIPVQGESVHALKMNTYFLLNRKYNQSSDRKLYRFTKSHAQITTGSRFL